MVASRSMAHINGDDCERADGWHVRQANTPINTNTWPERAIVSVYAGKDLAERVGFEPTLPFRVNTLSKRAPSATRPSLRRQVGKQLRRTNFSRRTRLHLLIDSMGEVAEPQLEAAYVTAALWKALCPEPAR